MDKENDNEFVEKTLDIFRKQGADIFQVEVYATLEVRKQRNKNPLRLQEKVSIRDVKQSEKHLHVYEKYQINSDHEPGLISPAYLKIDSTNKSVLETVDEIIIQLKL
ncbi:hypothetical protein NEF87_001062 [Candidatus Lokiarchaeum ossiferum]|uniref:Adenylyl-sulfate kinase n=1 Tax=Candidatus Lokiarchaeum ossiferum TaxID=2951803 RepID=A0ABY6HMP2_9ARCH|nr:hypothetical protein NEF87_001062 [Candidatus Lokiarchaeum sp. B-35]